MSITKNVNVKNKDNLVVRIWKTGSDFDQQIKTAIEQVQPGYKITFGKILIKTKEEPYCYIDDISFTIK